MKTHELKVWPRYFKPLIEGKKTFEIRINDRDYQVGDMLHLREFDYESNDYTGQIMDVEITYMIADQPYVPVGYVCMGISKKMGDVIWDSRYLVQECYRLEKELHQAGQKVGQLQIALEEYIRALKLACQDLDVKGVALNRLPTEQVMDWYLTKAKKGIREGL